MRNKDTIEFYDGTKGTLVNQVHSSMIPMVGSMINIRKKTWIIIRVTYALDHADDRNERRMRANVDLLAC